MTVKAIIFDIGGVLAYDVSEHLLFGDDGITSLYKLDRDVVRKVGAKLWNRFAHTRTTRNNDWQQLERDYWRQLTDELDIRLPVDAFVQLTNKFIRPIKGMSTLLDRLKASEMHLAICSNNTEFWFERQRKKLDFDRYFEADKVILSSRVGVSKNSRDFEMFRAVINALDVAKQDCLFVDDREENILKAIRYGISSILFPSHSKLGAEYLNNLLEKIGAFQTFS